MKSQTIQRGRPSAASIALRQEVLERTPRMPPPHDLTDEETEVWAAVINTEPADWFSPSTVPLLTQYCRHVIHARRIAEILERDLSTITMDDYSHMLKMQALQSQVIAMLATKMRIAQQSTTNHNGNRKKVTSTRRPWE